MRFSLVLESRLRGLLLREKRDNKKGKSRKLTKQDLAEIEEELSFLLFQPNRFLGMPTAASAGIQAEIVAGPPLPPPEKSGPISVPEVQDLSASAAALR